MRISYVLMILKQDGRMKEDTKNGLFHLQNSVLLQGFACSSASSSILAPCFLSGTVCMKFYSKVSAQDSIEGSYAHFNRFLAYFCICMNIIPQSL